MKCMILNFISQNVFDFGASFAIGINFCFFVGGVWYAIVLPSPRAGGVADGPAALELLVGRPGTGPGVFCVRNGSVT